MGKYGRLIALWLTVVVVAGAIYMHGRDERVIRRTWRQLVQQGQGKGPQNLLQSATRATGMLAFFATGAVIEIGAPYPMLIERGELPALLQRAWTYADSIEINRRGEDLSWGTSRETAIMEAAIELSVTVDQRRESGLESYRIYWQKDGRSWRISRIERMAIIRKPDTTLGQ